VALRVVPMYAISVHLLRIYFEGCEYHNGFSNVSASLATSGKWKGSFGLAAAPGLLGSVTPAPAPAPVPPAAVGSAPECEGKGKGLILRASWIRGTRFFSFTARRTQVEYDLKSLSQALYPRTSSSADAGSVRVRLCEDASVLLLDDVDPDALLDEEEEEPELKLNQLLVLDRLGGSSAVAFDPWVGGEEEEEAGTVPSSRAARNQVLKQES